MEIVRKIAVAVSSVCEEYKLRIEVGAQWQHSGCSIIVTKKLCGILEIFSHQAPEVHEAGNVSYGDDNVDHNE